MRLTERKGEGDPYIKIIKYYFTQTSFKASPVVLSMWPYKNYFSHPSFGYLLFSNLTHKTKIKNANMWETTNSKPPGPIIMVAWSETRKQQQSVAAGVSQIISVWTLSLAGVSLCCAVSSLSKLCKKMLGQNHFAESTGMFWLFFIQF